MSKTVVDRRQVAPNRLKEVLKAAGRSQEWLADRLGVHWQTVHRWANAKSDVTWSQATEIAGILGVDPISILAETATSRRVKVCGSLQAGLWTESFEWPEELSYEIGIPDKPEYGPMTLYAAEVRGESMNLVFPAGTIVVVERRTFGPHDLRPGTCYHVEIQHADGTVENTLKRMKTSGDGRLWLIPESSDPAFQTPILLNHTDGEHISAVGRVIYSLRAESFGP